jgi:hypothetical protein
MSIISVVDSFSEFPGLRNCNISDKSGEEFYHKVLNNEFYTVFIAGVKLTVNLDCTSGYAPSFLDEAFGNLVYDFTLKNVKNHIEIISDQEPHWKEMIERETYNQWENRRKEGKHPTVTAVHPAWWRIVDNTPLLRIWESISAV